MCVVVGGGGGGMASLPSTQVRLAYEHLHLKDIDDDMSAREHAVGVA
jgi:hypothetical protein